MFLRKHFFSSYHVCSFLFRELGVGDKAGIGDDQVEMKKECPGEEGPGP